MTKNFFFFLITFNFVITISQKEIKQQILNYQQLTQEFNDKKNEDLKYFVAFTNQQIKLLNNKKQEIFLLSKNIKEIKKNYQQNKNKVKEIILENKVLDEKELNRKQYLRKTISKKREELKKSFPFEIERKQAILSAILFDLNNNQVTSLEIFNRYIEFLNKEELSCYDSQVINDIILINKKPTPVELLRLGHVFLAVKNKQMIYLYSKNKDGYYLELTPNISLQQKRQIRIAFKMINGEKAPALLNLPIPKEILNLNIQ